MRNVDDVPDIDLSPEMFRKLGYRAVDLIAAVLATHSGSDTPARTPVPESIRQQLLTQPAPADPLDPDRLFENFRELILPYPMGNASPRFFGWVNSPAAPLGIIAELLLAAGMNPSVAGGDHAATYVEHAVLNWMKAWLRYPSTGGGILTSGGSVANLIGLAVMRTVRSEGNIRAEGFSADGRRMVLYTSTQGHSCLQKAVELLGFGSNALRLIPVDAEYRMDVAQLKEQLVADRAAGLLPVCVAATAGTVNTGAIDPLETIAELCANEGLWFHVDGAYGALGILAEQNGPDGLYRGMERADSLAVDPHKWMCVPVECGCALVRDAGAMRNAFSLVPSYLRDDTALPWFSEFGIQQSRGFRALKLWFLMQQVGERRYGELIRRNIGLAKALQSRIAERAGFELIAAGPLSVTCFRYAPEGVTDLDSFNRAVLARVQREGKVYLTSTELNGRFVLRACIVNFRTTEADLDELLNAVAKAGQDEVAVE